MNAKLNELVRNITNRYIILLPKRRAFVSFLMKRNKKDLIGIEIGASYGENALDMLKNLSIKKLFLIDSYKPYKEENKFNSDHKDGFDIIKKRMIEFNDKVRIIHDFSDKASWLIPSNLDFVYIDGNHDYEFVKRDIELYYPKLKKGGVIGGHDFLTMHLGVCKAVIEFITKNKLKLQGDGIDWWVVKNG
jgi:predicted O-methyltransferase YrrM